VKDIHVAISHHDNGTCRTIIKLIYKYPEATPRLESLSPSNLLDIEDRQGGISMTLVPITYHSNYLFYKHPGARLRLQSLLPYNMLDLGDR